MKHKVTWRSVLKLLASVEGGFDEDDMIHDAWLRAICELRRGRIWAWSNIVKTSDFS
jgi:hypothetical protein